MVQSYDNIEFDINGGVAILKLNRPDSLNSFNGAMHADVQAALALVADDETVRVLVLTGNGRGFCAGQDLSDAAVAPDSQGNMPDLGDMVDKYYNPLIRRLTTLEKPVICAVGGVAAGAGANIAFACDIVIAAHSANFIESFAKLGLVPDSGGSWILPRLVGMARAKGLAMLGPKISAKQAVDLGLIWQAVADDDLLPTTLALAEQMAASPTRGFALTKQAFNASASNSLDEQLELEKELMRQAGQTYDYKEGVNAFLEKRPPVYKGK